MSFILTKATGEEHFELIEKNAEIIWNERIPAVWNSPEMTFLAKKCISRILSALNTWLVKGINI